MAKESAFHLCTLCDWKTTTRGEGKKAKHYRYRWVIQCDPRNWVLALEREGKEPIGQKYTKNIEHLIGALEELDRMDCVEIIAQGIMKAFGDKFTGLNNFKASECFDSTKRACHNFVKCAMVLDDWYKLNHAYAPHDGVYDRVLAGAGENWTPINGKARPSEGARNLTYWPHLLIRNDSRPVAIKPAGPAKGGILVRKREGGLLFGKVAKRS